MSQKRFGAFLGATAVLFGLACIRLAVAEGQGPEAATPAVQCATPSDCQKLGYAYEWGRGGEKDYGKARETLLRAVAADPRSMQDFFQLGIAELEMSPADPTGFWHLAKSMSFARAQNNEAATQTMANYGKAKYRKYHGGEDGWEEIVANAAREAAVPTGFAAGIKAAPSAAELAVMAVAQNDPAELSFSDWEFVLSHRDASPARNAGRGPARHRVLPVARGAGAVGAGPRRGVGARSGGGRSRAEGGRHAADPHGGGAAVAEPARRA